MVEWVKCDVLSNTESECQLVEASSVYLVGSELELGVCAVSVDQRSQVKQLLRRMDGKMPP